MLEREKLVEIRLNKVGNKLEQIKTEIDRLAKTNKIDLEVPKCKTLDYYNPSKDKDVRI